MRRQQAESYANIRENLILTFTQVFPNLLLRYAEGASRHLH